MRSLRKRDIPYDTRLSTFDNQNSKTKKPDTRCSTFDNQNSKTKKPDIPPICRSLTTNCKLATADLSAQLPNDKNKFLTLGQTLRQRSPNTPYRMRTN